MTFRPLKEFRLSLRGKTGLGSWRLTRPEKELEIVVYINVIQEELPNLTHEALSQHLTYIFLIEWLCANVFTGTKLKKFCLSKKHKHSLKFCMPEAIAQIIMNNLDTGLIFESGGVQLEKPLQLQPKKVTEEMKFHFYLKYRNTLRPKPAMESARITPEEAANYEVWIQEKFHNNFYDPEDLLYLFE